MRELHARRIREMAVEEVRLKIHDLREELFNLSFRNSMRQLDNPLKIRETRRDLARLMTLLAEHEQGIRTFGTASGAASAAPAPKRRAGRAAAEPTAEAEAAPKAAKPKAAKKAAPKPKAKAAKKKTAKKKAAKPKAKPAKAKAAKKSGAAKAVTARRKSTAKRSARTTSK